MMNRTPAETALSKAMIRWSLSKAALIAETETSLVYKVEQNGRDPAVLKIIDPDKGADERHGAALLAWYGGEGAVTVFDAVEDAVFMEWVDGPALASLSRAGRDDEATLALAALVGSLHRPRGGAPETLTPLRQRFEPLFSTDPALWPRTARDLYARAVGIALALFDKPAPTVPLHGDLHHDNVLASPRGWLAIDPKGLVGDPAYDLANIFCNPLGATALVTSPARIAHLADAFSSTLGYSRRRILGYAAAHAALWACWDLAEGLPMTHQLAVLPHLLAAYAQA